MARLYMSGESDRCKTGRTFAGDNAAMVHLRTWDHGVKVYACITPHGLEFTIFRTGGSNMENAVETIHEFTVKV